VPAKQDFDAALAEAGKAIHDESCDRCHSKWDTCEVLSRSMRPSLVTNPKKCRKP
jgi:hypothetical protein